MICWPRQSRLCRRRGPFYTLVNIYSSSRENMCSSRSSRSSPVGYPRKELARSIRRADLSEVCKFWLYSGVMCCGCFYCCHYRWAVLCLAVSTLILRVLATLKYLLSVLPITPSTWYDVYWDEHLRYFRRGTLHGDTTSTQCWLSRSDTALLAAVCHCSVLPFLRLLPLCHK